MSSRKSIAVVLTCWLAMMAPPRAAGADSWNNLIRATYFSETCRQDAEAIGTSQMPNADALLSAFAAFERRRVIGLGDDRPDTRLDDCKRPAVLLINLLRLNGIDAELVFVAMAPAVADRAASEKIDRALVYVPSLDRYVDPLAPAGKQEVLDRIVRERAKRAHLRGPSLAADPRGVCPNTCMIVLPPRIDEAVRVIR